MTQRARTRVRDPIIVVGTFRSATTLVAEWLGSRPDHHYLGFELSERIGDATGTRFGAPGAGDRTCPPLDASDASPGQARSLEETLRRACEQEDVPAGARLVLKNPHLWHRLGWIEALLPEARLVATARDLQPTVASLEALWDRSLEREGHVHHLPEHRDHCWDYVPAEDRDRYPEERTFPGGSIEVLAEFWLRVNTRLAAAAQAGRLQTVARHERTLADPSRAIDRLQRELGLDPVELPPPAPIEPERQDEWRDRLDGEEHRVLEEFVARNRERIDVVDEHLAGRCGVSPTESRQE